MSISTKAPDPERCRVEVCAKRIDLIKTLDALAVVASGVPEAGIGIIFYHLYIDYTDPSGTRHVYRGGPERDFPSFGCIKAENGIYAKGRIDWDPNAIRVTLAVGAAARGLDACFAATLDLINQRRIRYDPRGPNSNTVIRTLLEECGLPVAQPVALAPGFGHPNLVAG